MNGVMVPEIIPLVVATLITSHKAHIIDDELDDRPSVCKSIPADKGVIRAKGHDFKDVRCSGGFTDKTMFLKVWLHIGEPDLYITAPPKFGKSALLWMMRHFFNSQYEVTNGTIETIDRNSTLSRQLFEKTDILKHEPEFFYHHFQKHNVITIDFSHLIAAKNKAQFIDLLCVTIKNMVRPYAFLQNVDALSQEDKDWIRNYASENSQYCVDNFYYASIEAGRKLPEILRETFGKPIIVLGDEFDSLLYAMMATDIPEIKSMMDLYTLFLQSFFKYAPLEGKITRSLLMGSLNLCGILSPLANNIPHWDFFKFEFVAKFLGLTVKEVERLLEKFHLSEHFKILKEWYDGYAVLNSSIRLFNTLSILEYIKHQKLESPCNDLTLSGSVLQEYKDYLSDRSIGSQILQCLYEDGASIMLSGVYYRELLDLKKLLKSKYASEGDYGLSPHQQNLFMTYLVESGLLSVSKEDLYSRWRRVVPANRETRKILEELFESSGYAEKRFKFSKEVEDKLVETIISLDPNVEKSVTRFGDAFHEAIKKFPPQKECEYMALLFSCSRKARIKTGRAFSVETDIVTEMIPEEKQKRLDRKEKSGKIGILLYWFDAKIALFIEGKYIKSAMSGLKQIFNNRCPDVFDTHHFYSKYEVATFWYMGMSVTRAGQVNIVWSINSTDTNSTMEYSSQETQGRGAKKTNNAKKVPQTNLYGILME